MVLEKEHLERCNRVAQMSIASTCYLRLVRRGEGWELNESRLFCTSIGKRTVAQLQRTKKIHLSC